MTMDLSFFRSETSQRLRAEGHAEGVAEGHAEAILLVLDGRGIAVDDGARSHHGLHGPRPAEKVAHPIGNHDYDR